MHFYTYSRAHARTHTHTNTHTHTHFVELDQRRTDIGWWICLGFLKLKISFRKRATTWRAFCRKWAIKTRHPLCLCHPVLSNVSGLDLWARMCCSVVQYVLQCLARCNVLHFAQMTYQSGFFRKSDPQTHFFQVISWLMIPSPLFKKPYLCSFPELDFETLK